MEAQICDVKLSFQSDARSELESDLLNHCRTEGVFRGSSRAAKLSLKASQVLQLHNLSGCDVQVNTLHQGTDYVQHVTVGQCGGIRYLFRQFVDTYCYALSCALA